MSGQMSGQHNTSGVPDQGPGGASSLGGLYIRTPQERPRCTE